MITLESQIENKLDKCPLCKHAVKVRKDSLGNFLVVCTKCRLTCGPWASAQILKNKWNKTPEQKEYLERIDFDFEKIWEAMKNEKIMMNEKEKINAAREETN